MKRKDAATPRNQCLQLVFLLLSVAGCPGSNVLQEAGPADAPPGWWDAGPGGDARLDGAAARSEGLGPGSERRPDGSLAPLLPQNLTLYINLGDSLGAGYYASAGHSYKALLVKNDDLLYPTYAGKDLKSRFPGIVVVDKAKSGATTSDVVQQALSSPGNASGNTLVVISAGGNDFNDNLQVMVDPTKSAAAAQKAAANLGKIAARFANKSLYPGQVTVLMLNIYDPTDETGNIPPLPGLSGFCTTIEKLGFLVGPLVVQNLAGFNKTLAGAVAASPGWSLCDNHQNFLGHGFHYNDPKSPHYQAADPTLWFYTDCAHGNDRGHHEIRRLLWQRLFGS